MWAKVVQRGVLLRERGAERGETTEALLLRNPNGTWELPGGKIEHGDTAIESLEREIEEETGLVVTDAEPIETGVRKLKRKKKRGKFAVVYRCEFEGEGGRVALSDEHVDFAWIDRERVERVNLKQVDEYRSLRRVLADSNQSPETGSTESGGTNVRPTTNGERDQ